MKKFDELINEFNIYNPLVFDLKNIDKLKILDSNFEILFSNNIQFPEFKLGFQHFIHQAKDKMEIVENFKNRKKSYLVTSLFEKNIDYKDETDDQIKYDSIDNGLKTFINEINKTFPKLLNRAFLKLWEMIIMFDLIPDDENFVSAHLAEGPGSFIQATILYRELLLKLKKIKSVSKDKYYGVTLHSDHDHLQMQKDFINYFEKSKRLNILETKSIKEIKDMYGGGKNNDITNGDLTKLNTILKFGGGKNIKGFSEPANLITADGGFDWNKENLQEQEAYKLIFSEIVTALKTQKNNGNFVIKIFESYTNITIKLIELLRSCYKEVYICKPFTSRISNSEKYIVCKKFEKSAISEKIIKKLENMIDTINKNEKFNIISMFTDIELSENIYNEYKKINLILLLKQYIGINNIIKFINLDNYNGAEYNEFLDKQIKASIFWNNLFLNTSNYKNLNKFIEKFNYYSFINNLKKEIEIEENKETEIKQVEEEKEIEQLDEEEKEIITKKNKNIKKSTESKTKKTTETKKSKTKTQKGGNIDESEEKINKSKKVSKNLKNSNKIISIINNENNDDLLSSDEDIIDLSKV